MSRRARSLGLLATIALSNALAVISLYIPQLVLPLVFPEVLDKPGWLPITAVFLGYCAGNANTAFNFISLISKNIRNHFVLLTAGLLLTSIAPTILAFTAACFLTGIGASVAQRLLGMAAHLAGPGRAGHAVAGCIATALFAVLGVRVLGEQVATVMGWRTIFVLMSVPFLGWSILGRPLVGSGERAGATLANMQDVPVHPIRLLASSRPLRRSMAQQAMVFASYNAAWVLLAAQLAPADRASASFWGPLAGIVALLGGGILIDRRRTRWLNRLGNAAMLVLGCPLLLLAYAAVAGKGGYPSAMPLVALPFGMALIDAGMQLTLVANQTRVQAIAPASRGRLASLLTIGGSLGGGLGGGLSHYLWQSHGWQAALALVVATATGGLLAACAPIRAPNPMPEGKRERRAMRLVRLILRIRTTVSARRWTADRDPRGELVNQGGD